jgi:cytochrome oxidase assembly protein ShyY1
MPSFAEQQVLGRIKLGEPDLNRQQPPRWPLASIDLADAKRQLGVRSEDFYSGVYLALDSEGIEQATMPTSLSKPQITEGNHLSYAFQWVIFAIMAFVALGWAIRQELEYRRAEQDPNYMKKKRKAFGDEDKEAEDSLL